METEVDSAVSRIQRAVSGPKSSLFPSLAQGSCFGYNEGYEFGTKGRLRLPLPVSHETAALLRCHHGQTGPFGETPCKEFAQR